MRIPLDHDSTVPLYQQIETYLRQNIISGKLLPETRLPATRQLAEKLGVSRITVTNAYAELESEGLIYSREGSGTYVSPPVSSATSPAHQAEILWPLWQHGLETDDDLPQHLRPDQISQQTVHPNPIIFSGVGDPRQFPIKDFGKAIQSVIRRDGQTAFKYGGFDGGYRPLRRTISHVLATQGIQANPDNTLITAGSQQAIALVCQLLLKLGDVILVEKPSYNLALELFQTCHLNIVGVSMDEQGMQVEQVETLLQQYHPKLIYTMPNFQNPTGVCLSGPRRRMLIQLAERYNVPILEDEFVGDLRYNGRVQPAIKALDQNGTVIYIGTFSKILMPGLRAGYLVADGPVFDRLVSYKRVSDLTTSTLIQRALDEYVTIGRYQTHLRRSCRRYRQRRDAIITAIKQYLPTVRFNPPQGGLFIWLELPEQVSSLALLPLAMQEGVGFSPGSNFFIHRTEGERYLRLNFATHTLEDIEVGIQRLAVAMRRLH
ncbi:PLP-dependent aminotransferase family protein [Anaerolineales bacterium HSG6]|nr:PLP-dependent aminotransferase family protein [Anaerolineales bacterium HSG6]